MADDKQTPENKFVSIVSSYLLNPEIKDDCSLDEFKSYFPSRYRSHDDVKHLHGAFITKKNMIKEAVRQHIEEFYEASHTARREGHQQSQTLKEVVIVLEMKRKELNEELLKAKSKLKVLRDNVDRCDKAVQDCHIMKTNSKKCYNLDMVKKLDSYLSEVQQDRVSSQGKENVNSSGI